MYQATHVLSLGGDCQVTYNLRKFFNFGSAYPFDWWITPLAGATRFLRELDCDRLYEPTLLEVMNQGRVYAVRNTYYDIRLHHEFPRNAEGHISENFRDLTSIPYKRQNYLCNKLKLLNSRSNKLLLFRSFIWLERAATRSQVVNFMDAAKTAFSDATCKFVFINPPEDLGMPDEVTILRFQIAPTPWQGDFEVWKKQLSSLNVSFLNVEGSHFVDSPHPTGESTRLVE